MTPEGLFAFDYDLEGKRTRAAFTPTGGTELWTAFVSMTGYGRLKTEQRWDGLDTGYEYDAAGNRTAIVWPDGWRAEYDHDELNRLEEVRGGMPGSVATLARYQYDARGRRMRLDFGPTQGSPVSSIAYTWQDDNDLEKLDHIFSGATGTVSFTHGYDRSARVTSAMVSPAGWIWQAPGGSNTESYGTANALDQYPNVAGQTLTWDTRGNLSAWSGLSFGHDSANGLLSASRSTGPTFSATYTYDGIDRRVSRAGSGTGVAAVRFVHAGDEEIAEWHPTTNTVLRRYVPGPAIDQPVAYVEHVGGTQVYYYHQDRLGNIIATANASGGLADRYVYTPYGVEHPLVATGQPLRYNARRFDPESGLYHHRARFYAPAIGRFVETDPVLYADQMSLYAYVGNDPLNATDPSGRDIYILTTDPFHRDPDLRHQAVLIGEPGAWVYISLDGTERQFRTGQQDLLPGQAHYDVRMFETFEDWADAPNLGTGANGAMTDRYTILHFMETSNEDSIRMIEAATAFIREHSTYNGAACNCGDLVEAAASVVDPDFPDTINPNATIDDLDGSPRWSRVERVHGVEGRGSRGSERQDRSRQRHRRDR